MCTQGLPPCFFPVVTVWGRREKGRGKVVQGRDGECWWLVVLRAQGRAVVGEELQIEGAVKVPAVTVRGLGMGWVGTVVGGQGGRGLLVGR